MTLDRDMHQLLLDHYNGKLTFVEALQAAYARGAFDAREEQKKAEPKKRRSDCKRCGTSREKCDARMMEYPKRCCPTCKEQGPAICHGRD